VHGSEVFLMIRDYQKKKYDFITLKHLTAEFKKQHLQYNAQQLVFELRNPGVYILENTPPGGGGDISRCHLGEKNMKRPREKGGKCCRKMKKGKEKGRKGKEN
jgi:hypothetical protein